MNDKVKYYKYTNIQKFVVSKMFRAEILYIHCDKVFK